MEPSPTETLEACPICGSRLFVPALTVKDHSVSKEDFQLVDCGRCGFRVTSPRPIPSAIGRYYESEDYISHTNKSASLGDRLYQWARGRALRNKHRLVSTYHATGSVLDVGCGTGEFLGHLASVGYAVQGVEPSPLARQQAASNHRLLVVDSLADIQTDRRFDLITLWHVLEHFHHPDKAVSLLNKNLSVGGHLFIAVPDRGSWDAYHFGPLWAAWDVPRHLSHFRQMDVEKLLSNHGLRVIRKQRMWFDAPYVSMLSERYGGWGPLVALIMGILVGGWSNLVVLFQGRPASSSLFIAEKVN